MGRGTAEASSRKGSGEGSDVVQAGGRQSSSGQTDKVRRFAGCCRWGSSGVLAVAGTVRRWGKNQDANAAAAQQRNTMSGELRKRAVVRAAAKAAAWSKQVAVNHPVAKQTKYVDSLGAVGGEAAGCLQSPGQSADEERTKTRTQQRRNTMSGELRKRAVVRAAAKGSGPC